MSLRIPAICVVLSLFILSSCSESRKSAADDGSKEKNTPAAVNHDTLPQRQSGQKTTLGENSSVMTGEIIDRKDEGEKDFELMVKIKATDDTLNYESLIVKGMVYTMKPGFIEENGVIVPIEKNRKLLELKDLPKGSTFSARVSLIEGNKCIIQEVLNNK